MLEVAFDLRYFAGAWQVLVEAPEVSDQPEIEIGGRAIWEILHHIATVDNFHDGCVELLMPGVHRFGPFSRLFSWLAV